MDHPSLDGEVEEMLDDETLERMAEVLARVREEEDGVPLAALVSVGELGIEGRVTVDFGAAKSLGHPLVVYTPSREPPVWWARLTEREREVAALVADGHSNATIAERLGITVATTKDHVHRILKKSGLRRRSQVAASLAER